MPRYLWKVSYTAEGVRGILKEGGTHRRAFIEQLVKELGGNVESFHFAFGDDDVYVIADLPNDATAAAISLTASASGAASVKTVKLLTAEEIDDATQISVAYKPPGA